MNITLNWHWTLAVSMTTNSTTWGVVMTEQTIPDADPGIVIPDIDDDEVPENGDESPDEPPAEPEED